MEGICDGSKYIVMKLGEKQTGIKVTVALTTGAMILVGGVGIITSIGFLFFSKEGKAFRKNHLGGV